MESHITQQQVYAISVWELEKRVFDFIFSLLVLLFLLSWLIPLMTLLIKLDSKGPVFFKQLRTGRNGTPFYCLKFRSMHINGQADSIQACRGDIRVTRMGRFIRKTSIDELPQFLNVLKGEMSIVGPRPHMIKHTELYNGLLDNFMLRHMVTPGITGWAQVIGYRGETKGVKAMLNRLNADIWYLENWSMALDFKIMILTVFVCFKETKNVY